MRLSKTDAEVVPNQTTVTRKHGLKGRKTLIQSTELPLVWGHGHQKGSEVKIMYMY